MNSEIKQVAKEDMFVEKRYCIECPYCGEIIEETDEDAMQIGTKIRCEYCEREMIII